MTLALERDEKGIRRWVRKVWPSILQRARRTGATIVFVDEADKQTTPDVRRSWAKRRRTPVLRGSGSRQRWNVVIGVTLKGEVYFPTHRENMGGTEAMGFPEQLLEEIPGKVLVIWDNGAIPTAPEVRTFAGLSRQRLELWRSPPYAPEYDPQETMWDVLKNDRMGTTAPRTWTISSRP